MGRPRKRQVASDNRSNLIIAYIRVSTAKQALSGLGLDAQEAALRAELIRLGVDPDDSSRVLWLVEDGKSAKTMNRPKMRHARHLLASGQAGTPARSALAPGPASWATLRNLVIGMLCRAGPVNVAAALRRHAHDPRRPLRPSGISLG